MLAIIVVVFSKMPKNYNDVEGPSTLDDFTGALILLSKESIAVKLFMQSLMLVGWLVKNHPSSEASVLLHNYEWITSDRRLNKSGQTLSQIGGWYLHRSAGITKCPGGSCPLGILESN